MAGIGKAAKEEPCPESTLNGKFQGMLHSRGDHRSEGAYPDALRTYPNKGLLAKAAAIFRFKLLEFTTFILRILASDSEGSQLRLELHNCLPGLTAMARTTLNSHSRTVKSRCT